MEGHQRPAQDYINQLQAFLAKVEGRDKLLATLQYAAMFAAAGAAGNALQIQKNISSSRKPFRILKPAETVLPLVTAPLKTTPAAVLAQTKALSMTAFFLFDHIVWAGSVGLVKDKERLERAQKLSFYGWLLGALCGLAQEGVEIQRLAVVASSRPPAAAEGSGAEAAAVAEATKKADAAVAALHTRAINAACLGTQAIVAAGLLQLLPLKPRTIGTFGIISSLLSCYQALPALPALPSPKSKAA